MTVPSKPSSVLNSTARNLPAADLAGRSESANCHARNIRRLQTIGRGQRERSRRYLDAQQFAGDDNFAPDGERRNQPIQRRSPTFDRREQASTALQCRGQRTSRGRDERTAAISKSSLCAWMKCLAMSNRLKSSACPSRCASPFRSAHNQRGKETRPSPPCRFQKNLLFVRAIQLPGTIFA